MPTTLNLKTKPVCERCGREVDALTEHYDMFMRRVRFVAHCHGEREYVDVDETTIAYLGDKGISFGVAFALPPLLGDKSESG